jgi:hypothetical protein
MPRSALFVQQQSGGMFAVEDSSLTTGNRWFVNSATGVNSVGAGRNPDQPFASLAYALTQVTASQGDIIYLMPGHNEAIAAAATLALSVAGITIIGLGARNNRPTFTFAGVDSLIGISGAGCVLRNVRLVAGIDEIVTAISVTAAFVELDRVDISEVTSKQFIQFCLTTAAATDLIIQNCVHHQSTAPAASSLWIQLVGADRAKILNNQIFITTTNSASSSVIESDTTAPVNIRIEGNRIVQLGGTGTIPINLVTSTSGLVHNNIVASAKTAIAGSIALASCYGGLNYAAHVVNKSGLLEPVVDA